MADDGRSGGPPCAQKDADEVSQNELSMGAMSNYAIWTVEMLGARIIEWRERLQHAKTKEQLLSIWGEIEKMETEFDRAVFEGRTEASRRERTHDT